jgi:hypothetical protein
MSSEYGESLTDISHFRTIGLEDEAAKELTAPVAKRGRKDGLFEV